MKKKIVMISCFFILLGIGFGIVDYHRVKNLQEPIFTLKVNVGNNNTWHYIGLGYCMKREISVSLDEAYSLDENVKFGFWFYTWKLNFNTVVDDSYTIDPLKSNSCSTNLYYEEESRSVYLYCLDGIWLNNEKERVELKDYLNRNHKNINDFIQLFLLSETYDDGGSRMYKEIGSSENADVFTNHGLSILECNTLDENHDIYLGPSSMEYEDNFCRFNTEEQNKSFTRTYYVDSIHLDNKDEQIMYLTLSQFQGETNMEVKVLKKLANDVKMGYYYEFTFEYTDNHFENSIKGIFENTTLKEIKKTDKVGIGQVQEEIS